MPWPCVSWPRTKETVTRLQSIGPSSGSVTVTVHGTVSPQLKKVPDSGEVTFTVGAVLPTVISRVSTAVLPLVSVTVSLAVKTPLVV